MRAATAIAATCCFLCLVSGCAPEPPAPIGVGLLLPAATLPREIQAARLAVDQINGDGGVRVDGAGRPLDLLVADSRRLPHVAISKAYELIHSEGVVALLGLPLSHNAIPVARVAESNGVPLISTRSSHPDTTADHRFVFRLCYLDSFQAEVLARFAVDELGASRAGLFVEAANSYSLSLARSFSERFEKLGGQIVATERFAEPGEDVSGPMRRLAAAGPDVVLLPYFGRVVMTHMVAAHQAGLRATLLGGDSWGAIDPAPPALPGPHYFVDVWAPERADPASASFVRDFTVAFGVMPTNGAALTFDAVHLLRQAIERAGSAEPEAIRFSLESIVDFEGATGRLSFAHGHDPRRSAFLRALGDDGRRRLVTEVHPW